MSKRLLFGVFFLICSSIGANSYAAQDDQGRIYVKGGVVKPSKNGFTITAKGWTIHTKALRHDKNGMYVLISDRLFEKRYDPEDEWYECAKCHLRFHGIYGPNGVKAHIAKEGPEHSRFWPDHW